MDQRLSFVTLAVADLARTHAFYVEGLGWRPELYEPDEVLMIRLGERLVLSLWAEREFEAEVGPIRRGAGVAPITLAHNVRTEAEVDQVLAWAGGLGAAGQRTAAPGVGRVHRVLRGPRRLPVGGRHQPRPDRPARPALRLRASGPGRPPEPRRTPRPGTTPAAAARPPPPPSPSSRASTVSERSAPNTCTATSAESSAIGRRRLPRASRRARVVGRSRSPAHC